MTPREQEMLVVLANHTPVLAISQIARTWWPNHKRQVQAATESARGLMKSGWVEIHQVLSRPITTLSRPLVAWKPSSRNKPDFERLSKRLHQRAQKPASAIMVVTAARKSLGLFGDGKKPGRINLTQMTHDLQVAEVFLTYRARVADIKKCWVGEHELGRTWPIRQKPDALLLGEDGAPCRAIEYGGDYSVQRLTTLHGALASIDLPYEVW